MARARNIKPGFFRNEVLAECSAMARLLFIGLWCEADREGRLEYRPKRLKAAILPYDDDCPMHDLIMELAQKGFVRLYKVGGDEYLEVCNFLKHQQPHHKEVASVIPSPEQADSHAQAKHEPSMSQASVNQSAPCPTDSLIPLPSSLNPIPDCGSSKDRSPSVELAEDWEPPEFVKVRLVTSGGPKTWTPQNVGGFVAHYRSTGLLKTEKQWGELFVKWMLKEASFGRPQDPDAEIARFVAMGGSNA